MSEYSGRKKTLLRKLYDVVFFDPTQPTEVMDTYPLGGYIKFYQQDGVEHHGYLRPPKLTYKKV